MPAMYRDGIAAARASHTLKRVTAHSMNLSENCNRMGMLESCNLYVHIQRNGKRNRRQSTLDRS